MSNASYDELDTNISIFKYEIPLLKEFCEKLYTYYICRLFGDDQIAHKILKENTYISGSFLPFLLRYFKYGEKIPDGTDIDIYFYDEGTRDYITQIINLKHKEILAVKTKYAILYKPLSSISTRGFFQKILQNNQIYFEYGSRNNVDVSSFPIQFITKYCDKPEEQLKHFDLNYVKMCYNSARGFGKNIEALSLVDKKFVTLNRKVARNTPFTSHHRLIKRISDKWHYYPTDLTFLLRAMLTFDFDNINEESFKGCYLDLNNKPIEEIKSKLATLTTREQKVNYLFGEKFLYDDN